MTTSLVNGGVGLLPTEIFCFYPVFHSGFRHVNTSGIMKV